jgi:hypothetical protein
MCDMQIKGFQTADSAFICSLRLLLLHDLTILGMLVAYTPKVSHVHSAELKELPYIQLLEAIILCFPLQVYSLALVRTRINRCTLE